MSITTMGALRAGDRPAWVKAVKTAMREARGGIPEAAAKLGVGVRSLFRWLSEPEFADVKKAPAGLRRDRKPAVQKTA